MYCVCRVAPGSPYMFGLPADPFFLAMHRNWFCRAASFTEQSVNMQIWPPALRSAVGLELVATYVFGEELPSPRGDTELCRGSAAGLGRSCKEGNTNEKVKR